MSLSNTMREIVNLKERMNEMELKMSQFMEMLSNKNRADIDYIAMETDVDLDQDTPEN